MRKKKHIWNCYHIFWSPNAIKGKSLKIKKSYWTFMLLGQALKDHDNLFLCLYMTCMTAAYIFVVTFFK
jgi:hypothetical protein